MSLGAQTSWLPRPALEPITDQAVLLPGFASLLVGALPALLQPLLSVSPWRHMVTPGGKTMSVAMTNCGQLGWVTDRCGYRYQPLDPDNGCPWPPMPSELFELAQRAALAAGFRAFEPDACLINHYVPGARLTLHQDRNERDLASPVVSVSAGLPAVFLFGGLRRRDPTRRIRLQHGDAVVWGGSQRLAFHGVAAVPDGEHPIIGRCRINLTLRRAQ